MKKIFVLFLGLLMVLSVAATADINNWQIKCGISGNLYPYGNDFGTRFGVDSTGTYAYDSRDSVHPAIGDPFMDLSFVYKPYQASYTGDGTGFTWVTGGRLMKNGVQVDSKHGPGLPSVGWPSTGLIKDTRAPILPGDVKEYWRVAVTAPQEGDGVFFTWAIDTEAGLETPQATDPVFYAKIKSNDDLIAAGITGDLFMTGRGAGTFQTAEFPQFGVLVDEEGTPTGPVIHTWTIEAGIPEPGTIMLMAGGLLGIGGLIRRRK